MSRSDSAAPAALDRSRFRRNRWPSPYWPYLSAGRFGDRDDPLPGRGV